MPVDYAEVLKDLDSQIDHHQKAIEELRAARPAIVALRNRSIPVATPQPYSGLGATAAIRALMSKSNAWYNSAEILETLVTGGWTSNSAEPSKVVASTLSNLKAEGWLDKQHDMWRWMAIRNVPLNVQTDQTVFDSPGASGSLKETIY